MKCRKIEFILKLTIMKKNLNLIVSTLVALIAIAACSPEYEKMYSLRRYKKFPKLHPLRMIQRPILYQLPARGKIFRIMIQLISIAQILITR